MNEYEARIQLPYCVEFAEVYEGLIKQDAEIAKKLIERDYGEIEDLEQYVLYALKEICKSFS